ncbi:MAG TPA: hydroxymethylbilane synthase [Wenzhouxiangella sp.]|nr:hydroxymethylbilane synthase [Wenzhouxiangella sp.]
MNKLRIATRKSALAIWQAEHVAQKLRDHHPELDVSLVPLSTRGDEILDRSLAEIGGKGLFLKELERALLANEADIAVHSLKDVPAVPQPDFELVAYPPRASWHDVWITRDGSRPEDLPAGAMVGTASLRRQGQILALCPQLEVKTVRGNVQTRLGRLDEGAVDALILAAAGLERLQIRREHSLALKPPGFLPSAGQGAIVVQCRAGDDAVSALAKPLDCTETRLITRAERAVVAELGGDCRMPLAALARLHDGQLHLHARLVSLDGTKTVNAEVQGAPEEASALGRQAAKLLLSRGGAAILSQI